MKHRWVFQGDMVGEERSWGGMEKAAKQSLNNKDISKGWIVSMRLEKGEFSLSLFLEVEVKMNEKEG